MHKRLAIIDLVSGDQPMIYEHKGENYVIVYNGELYNTEDIRKELKALGHKFVGHSDTEVLIHSYAEWGEHCLTKLNGIYAFAIWKEHSEELLLVRDRMGVKPLFYYLYDNGIVFGSEVKAIFANPIARPIIDKESFREIFYLGPGKRNGSAVFKGIIEIKPGEYVKYRRGKIQTVKYWDLKSVPHNDNLEQTVEHTRWLVSDAIIRQLVSDVPIACFLSGGLDSSIITAVATEYYKRYDKPMTTYSVDYRDNNLFFLKNSYQPDMDNPYIKLMVERTGSEHKDIILENSDLGEALYEATEAREAPGMADIDSSLLLFCREIRKKNKVCISGECADEIFGGYPWYHREELLYRDSFPWAYSLDLRSKLINPDVNLGDGEDFVRGEYLKTIGETDYLDSDAPADKRIREMFRLNMDWFMQTLLIRSDRMASYNGLEVRVPYCDHRLVEYAYNIPWHYKSLYGREKGILREAFKDILPYEIVNRKKSPYPKTFNPEFMTYVTEEVKRIIEDKSNPVNNLVNGKFLSELINSGAGLSEPWYGQLMRLPQIYAYVIQLDYFLKIFKPEIQL
jgi:asparagine synthase (glutamine-hydrolysing)